MIPFALRRRMLASASGGISFSYTGNYSIEGNVLRLLTSGTLTIDRATTCDIFLVGGGGAGAARRTWSGTNSDMYFGGGAGGGGYTKTILSAFLKSGEHTVTIGDGGVVSSGNGGATSFDDYSANGGLGGVRAASSGSSTAHVGGDGGSGGGAGGVFVSPNSGSNYTKARGVGGTDGSNGGSSKNSSNTTIAGGTGQGTTTRAFGEEDGELFATGGDGGDGGSTYEPQTKTANTGDGGDGARGYSSKAATAGASGIVLIRFAAGTKIEAA